MEDRELLEMAAKAADIDYDGDGCRLDERTNSGAPVAWNPLTDDGDALRLAVSLNMDVQTKCYDDYDRSYATAWIYDDCALEVCSAVEYYDSKPYAATRRAIVRCAAQIGRSM